MDPPIPFRAGVAGAFLHPTWKTGTTTHESTASEVLYLYTARSGRGLYQSSRPPDFHANQRAAAGDVRGFSGCHTLVVGKSGFCYEDLGLIIQHFKSANVCEFIVHHQKLVKGGNLALQHEASLPVIAMNAQMDTKFIYNLKSNYFLPDRYFTIE